MLNIIIKKEKLSMKIFKRQWDLKAQNHKVLTIKHIALYLKK